MVHREGCADGRGAGEHHAEAVEADAEGFTDFYGLQRRVAREVFLAGEVFLSDYAVLNFGGLTATCIGECGSLGADGDVTAPPSGPTYAYVTTNGGEDGAGPLAGNRSDPPSHMVHDDVLVIVLAGVRLARYGDVLGEKTGLGRSWIGVVLSVSGIVSGGVSPGAQASSAPARRCRGRRR